MLRRHFLIIISSVSAAGLLSARFGSDLIRFFSVGPGPAVLTEPLKTSLWRLVELINREWPLHEDISAIKGQFFSFLESKTAKSSKYIKEYQKTHELLMDMKDEEVLSLLRSGDSPFKKVVVQEFAHFLIYNDGFKKFGLKNFRGYMGGPFENRPYR